MWEREKRGKRRRMRKRKKKKKKKEEDGLYAISSTTIPVLWLLLPVHDIIAWHVTEPSR